MLRQLKDSHLSYKNLEKTIIDPIILVYVEGYKITLLEIPT